MKTSTLTVTTMATNNRTTNSLTIKCPTSEYSKEEVIQRKVHISTCYHIPPKNKMIQTPRSSVVQTATNQNNSGFYRISDEQMAVLENEFLKLKTLHTTDLQLLAAELGLDEKDVQTWYHERLAAWRRGQGLSDAFGQL